ncbi:MAG: 50S ribosomal protein L31 [bacterium]
MKTETHPTYFAGAKATCACGNVMSIGSTREKLSVEICSACHPFYTGNEKVMDTAGRVEKFKAHRAAAKPARHNAGPATKKVSKKASESEEN